MEQLTEEWLFDTYKKYFLKSSGYCFNNYLFKPYGLEFDRVYSLREENKIMSLLSIDGDIIIKSGYYVKNIIGYFISTVTIKEQFEIKLYEEPKISQK